MSNHEKESEVQPDLPETIREALIEILTYLWEDERKNFLADPKEGHVFHALVAVDCWLDRHPRTNDEWDSGQEYWRVCPECRRHDGYLNIGRAHWFVCHTHRVKWCVGDNLFSTWKFQTEAHWQQNWARIRSYRAVEPLRSDAA